MTSRPTLLGDVPGSSGVTRHTLLPLRVRVFTTGTTALLDLCANRRHLTPLDPAELPLVAGDELARALRNGLAWDLPGARAVSWDPTTQRLSVHRHYLTLAPAQARKLARLLDKALHPAKGRRRRL